jgi:hypothetical protein
MKNFIFTLLLFALFSVESRAQSHLNNPLEYYAGGYLPVHIPQIPQPETVLPYKIYPNWGYWNFESRQRGMTNWAKSLGIGYEDTSCLPNSFNRYNNNGSNTSTYMVSNLVRDSRRRISQQIDTMVSQWIKMGSDWILRPYCCDRKYSLYANDTARQPYEISHYALQLTGLRDTLRYSNRVALFQRDSFLYDSIGRMKTHTVLTFYDTVARIFRTRNVFEFSYENGAFTRRNQTRYLDGRLVFQEEMRWGYQNGRLVRQETAADTTIWDYLYSGNKITQIQKTYIRNGIAGRDTQRFEYNGLGRLSKIIYQPSKYDSIVYIRPDSLNIYNYGPIRWGGNGLAYITTIKLDSAGYLLSHHSIEPAMPFDEQKTVYGSLPSACLTRILPTDDPEIPPILTKVYPNPTSGDLYFEWASPTNQLSQLTIFDISGKVITRADAPVGTTVFPISLSSLSNGLYFYKIQSKNHQKVGKIVLMR